jgi:hypothetical protein
MIWFLEKDNDLLICEIRRADDEQTFEFEVADARGPRTQRYATPSALITGYLHEQAQLRAQGWRPRAGEIAVLA